ncbi:hypothetical protein D3C80_1158230 [compost metagenome]
MYFPGVSAGITYLPSTSVEAPFVVPLIFTVTPISVSPVFLSDTLPEIFPVCANTAALIITNRTVIIAVLRFSCDFNLLYFNFQQSYYHNVSYMLASNYHSFTDVLRNR